MSIARYDYDRRVGRLPRHNDDTKQPQRDIMPVVTMMPLKRFARAVDSHTAANGTPPELIWPTETGDRLVKRKRLL